MEEWQKEHIRGNLYDLLQSTSLNTILLMTLQGERILSQLDIDELEAEANNNGKPSQTLKFYAILQAKGNNAYEALIKALQNTRQLGAVKILESVTPPNAVAPSRKIETAHGERLHQGVNQGIEGGMDERQKKHIAANLDILVNTTTIGAPFMTKLISKGLLNRNDIWAMEAESNTGLKIVKFYELMQAKENNAYDKLVEALAECMMTGAAEILRKL